MALFNINEMLNVTEATDNESTFAQHIYINTNFLEEAQNIADSMKSEYRKAYLELHRNAILNDKIEYSKFYESVSNTFMNTSGKIKVLQEKAKSQFNHYKKTYNLTDVSLGGPVIVTETASKLCLSRSALPSSICSKLSPNKNLNQILKMGVSGDLSSLNETSHLLIKNARNSMNLYRNKNLSESAISVTNENFISYLEESVSCTVYDESEFSYRVGSVLNIAQDLNEDKIINNINSDIYDISNVIYDGAETLLSMIDKAIDYESMPFPTTEQQDNSNIRNSFMTTALSQYVEQVTTDLIAVGYKTDVLFEDMLICQRIVDKAVDKTKILRESGQISPADIILTEALYDINY